MCVEPRLRVCVCACVANMLAEAGEGSLNNSSRGDASAVLSGLRPTMALTHTHTHIMAAQIQIKHNNCGFDD